MSQDLSIELRKKYFELPHLSVADQIIFFKGTKPRIISELHYQMEIFNYLRGKPKGSVKIKKQHINLCMDRAAGFIAKHCEFNHYIQLNSNHLDHIYFSKVDYDPKIHGHLEYPVDMKYSAPADPTLSCIMAATRYLQFLKNELFTLKNPTLDATWENMKSIRWKKSKTDLVELVYALYATQAVNGELKDIINTFEKLFNIDLGNFYRTYTDIKYKKDPTTFINELKNSLLEKMTMENR